MIYDEALLDGALAVGQQYLDAVHPTTLADEAAERPVWVHYHQLMLEALDLDVDRADVAEEITRIWATTMGVEPYPWTVPTLGELSRRGVPVVVLSDVWPSLRRWFHDLGSQPVCPCHGHLGRGRNHQA